MESLPVRGDPQEQEVFDIGHAAVVDFELDSTTYVTKQPIEFGGAVIFESDLDPYQKELLEFVAAPMRQYQTLEEFVSDERSSDDTRGTINFMGYFQEESTVAALAKKTTPAFQRLCIVAPELVAGLESAIGYNDIPPAGFQDLSRETLSELHRAYQIMSCLVSEEESLRLYTGGYADFDSEILLR